MEDNSSNLQKALDCIEYPPHQGIQTTPGRPFGYHMMNLIREDLPISVDADKISISTVSRQIQPILKEAAFKDDPEQYFEDEIDDYISKLKRSNPTEHEITFPLNIEPEEDLPDKFNIQGQEIRKIDRDTWINEYKNPAGRELDKLRQFFRRSPNDEENESYSYWLTRCSANGPAYAVHEAILRVRLLLAKIDYSRFVGMLHPSSSGLPKIRWSRVERPYFSLVFESEEPIHFSIADYESRKPILLQWNHYDRFTENFRDLPQFDIESSDFDRTIVESLYEYQEALTTRRRKDAFFSIWRAIETLTQTNREISTKEVLDRAQFALNEYQPEKEWTEPLRNTITEIDDLRNDIAHEAGRITVSQYHYEYAKILLDSLFEFYFDHRNLISLDEMRYVLQYGASGEQCIEDLSKNIEDKKTAIETLEEIF